MKRLTTLAVAALLLVAAPLAFAGEKEGKRAQKKAEMDSIAKAALEEVLGKSDKAPELFEKAHGWAVFDNWKFALLFSGGGGGGVAVKKSSGERTYMKMGTGGVGLGLGGQKYQIVFFFEDQKTFENFVDNGWQADTGATAAAGTAGANAASTFTNGLAVYRLTEAGLMANADIAGTRYWKNKKLNGDVGGEGKGEAKKAND